MKKFLMDMSDEWHKELINEWHPTLNGDITPSNVLMRSNKKVWWLCKEGHEWQAKVCARSRGGNCPYCMGEKAILRKTDLATVSPELSKEWHPTLNGELKPTDVTAFSHKKVWWRCKDGHEWKTRIADRSNGDNCPFCAGKKPIPGETDLATVNSVLASEWHPTLNGELKPTDVTAFSHKKVWWRCNRGHIWETVVYSRGHGKDCPFCRGNLAITGETDLATVNPVLASEWHPNLNGELKPMDVTAFSNKKVWWRCKEGHEWKTTVNARSNGSDCPYCMGRNAIPGLTDFATVKSVISKEWHPTLNGELKPTDVTAFSNKKVWWRCKEGHEWKSIVSSRSNGSNCPYCMGRNAISGLTDFATVKSEISKEWHPTLNGELKPTDVTASSGKIVWWRCKVGHEWKATVRSRNNGSGCPYCMGKKAIIGETDLATVNPELSKEWHPTLNRDLKPTDVTEFSNKKVWWRCNEGHEWKRIISARSNGSGCPHCYGLKSS